jgi:hypothetical protein
MVSSIADCCRQLPGVTNASADIIPGPPPGHILCLVANLQLHEGLLQQPAETVIAKGRGVASQVFGMIMDNRPVLPRVLRACVAIVVQTDDSPICVYSVTIRWESLTNDPHLIAIYAENEFSMIDTINVLLGKKY